MCSHSTTLSVLQAVQCNRTELNWNEVALYTEMKWTEMPVRSPSTVCAAQLKLTEWSWQLAVQFSSVLSLGTLLRRNRTALKFQFSSVQFSSVHQVWNCAVHVVVCLASGRRRRRVAAAVGTVLHHHAQVVTMCGLILCDDVTWAVNGPACRRLAVYRCNVNDWTFKHICARPPAVRLPTNT